jgi:hypothetical protein
MSQQFKIENSIIGMFKKILEYKNVQSNIQTGGAGGAGGTPPTDDVAQQTDEITVEFNEIKEAYGIRTTKGKVDGLNGFDVEFSLEELIELGN